MTLNNREVVSRRDYGTISIPTNLVSHILCIIVAMALTVIASIFVSPQSATFNGFISLSLPFDWSVSLISLIINFAITLLLVVIISTIANRFSITTLLSLFPTLFFLMLQCCNPLLSLTLQMGVVGAVMVLGFTYYLFEYYGAARVERVVFGSTLLMCATLLVWDKMLFFIPLFWIGLLQMNILTLRSFIASLMAIATSIIMYISIDYLGWINPDYIGAWHRIKDIISLADYKVVSVESLFQMAYIIPVFLVVCIYNISMLYSDSKDKISTKRYIVFLNTIFIFSVLMMLLNPIDKNEYLPIFNASSAILAARYFNTIRSKAKLRFLLLFILTYITIFIVWIW
ncbi:MAG: hypothetical protein J6L02_00250 [Bacteroidales bacterium]|nr:hypothetical protein [Bacteroidales bacterium]